MDGWRARLIKSLASVEAFLDFGEDDEISEDALFSARDRAAGVLNEMERQLQQDGNPEALRTGVSVALVGPPNAGKSTLLNVLARRPAALVSPTPGTTRDVIEVRLDLGGVLSVVSDTAGMRLASGDAIEEEGMQRAANAWRSALVRVLVLDVRTAEEDVVSTRALLQDPAVPGETTRGASEAGALVVLNKCP
ncbi:P-loop containing nucleoside triphosphate hydrolase protein [Baffinella frigidus]|nr:P-loop containing nucleoside triphosphate hydrolase protein [Cryptophyta sp. CCMP2293]